MPAMICGVTLGALLVAGLAIVGAMVDRLIRGRLAEAEAETLRRDAAGRLMAIIRDILDFSRIEAGKLALDPAPFDLEEAIDGSVALLRSLCGTAGSGSHRRCSAGCSSTSPRPTARPRAGMAARVSA